MKRTAGLHLASGLLGGMLLHAHNVGAQSGPTQLDVTAEALKQKARTDMTAGNYERACPEFEQLVSLKPEGIGARYGLGDCYKLAGKLASAWSTYSAAASLAARQNDVKREAELRALAQQLWPALAQLTVVVPSDVSTIPDLAIKRDGVSLPPAQWGSPVPIDRGKHLVEASAPGRQRWATSVEIQNDGETLSVSVATLAEAPRDGDAPPLVTPPPPPAILPTPTVALSPSQPEKAATDAAPTAWSTQKTTGLAAAALGVVALGAGVVAGVKATQAQSASNTAPSGSTTAHCRTDDRCDPEGLALRGSAISAARWSTGLFVASGVALAGGIVLFATAPSPRQNATLKVGLGLTRLTVEGAW